MSNVISLFQNNEDNDPQLSGTAHCITCKHKWVAAAPAGTVWLECPSCGSIKGLFDGPCSPPENAAIWQCYCTSRILYATPNAVHCYNCGAEQVFPR